jgi:hypothetical protein
MKKIRKIYIQLDGLNTAMGIWIIYGLHLHASLGVARTSRARPRKMKKILS